MKFWAARGAKRPGCAEAQPSDDGLSERMTSSEHLMSGTAGAVNIVPAVFLMMAKRGELVEREGGQHGCWRLGELQAERGCILRAVIARMCYFEAVGFERRPADSQDSQDSLTFTEPARSFRSTACVCLHPVCRPRGSSARDSPVDVHDPRQTSPTFVENPRPC